RSEVTPAEVSPSTFARTRYHARRAQPPFDTDALEGSDAPHARRREASRPEPRGICVSLHDKACQTMPPSPKPDAGMSSAASTSNTVDGAFIRSRLGSFLAVVPLSIW